MNLNFVNMMKVSELKRKVDEAVERGYGDLPVEIYQQGNGGSTRTRDVLYDEISFTLYDFV